MAEDEELPEDVKAHILGTDTVIFGSYYLARPENELLHPSRVSANHRGEYMSFSLDVLDSSHNRWTIWLRASSS
jgi:hypothetical protein